MPFTTRHLTLIIFLLSQCTNISYATDDIEEESLDDLLSDFPDTAIIPNDDKSLTPTPSWNLTRTTALSLSSSYNTQQPAPASDKTDYRGLSRLKIKIFQKWRYKLTNNWKGVSSFSLFYDAAYFLNNRDQYTKETLARHESELEIRDTYIRGNISKNFDIKIGRQIVVWGAADYIRVVDVLNPLDLQEPGMTDIEDIRIPVTMIKANYYFYRWNISAIAIPEIRFHKLPAYGSEFYLSDQKLPPEEKPNDLDLNTLELAISAESTINDTDISFYIANYFDDETYFRLNNNLQPISQVHSKLLLFGLASNIAFGDWLIKLESAYIDRIKFTAIENDFSRADTLIGLDYFGLSNSTLSAEIVNRKIFNYKKNLPIAIPKKENENELIFRYTGSFMREKINVTAMMALLGLTTDAGGYYRGSIKYEIMDATSITIGGIIYQSGSNFITQKIARNDRVFFDFRYSF